MYRLSRETRSVVEQQSWTSDDDLESIDLLHAIYRVECFPQLNNSRFPDFTPEPLAILQASEAQEWYRDSLNSTEKVRLTAFYEAYLRLPGKNPGDLLAFSIQRHLYRELSLPKTGAIVLIAVGEDSQAVSKTLDFIEPYLQQLDDWFGPLALHSVSVAVQKTKYSGTCGEAYAQFAVIVFDPACSGFSASYALAHEAVHLFFGGNYPLWYTEGAAHFWAAYLTSSLVYAKDQMEVLLRELNASATVSRESRDPDAGRQDAAGFLLLNNLYEVLGRDAMIALGNRVKTGASGQGIVDAIRVLTPPSQLATVDELIEEHVGTSR